MAGTPKSCTSCRQAKVGCDARKKPPNTPCTRCSKNQLECRFDKNFKRILTRKLTANLTSELHQLRMSQAALAGEQSSPAAIRLREPELPPAPSSFFYINITEPLSDFTTGDVTIAPGTIIELIQHFGRQYHVHAHFVQPIESLAAFSATSPLLFWTIILLSSHFHPQHSDLFDQLLLPHEELLKPLSNTAIQSIHEIQALLLLCLWPTPKRQEWASPTWNYIGLAVGSCMRLDLDKTEPLDLVAPQLSSLGQEQREEISLRTRKLTWLACLAISTQEATFLGLLPPLSSRPHLKHCRRAIDEVKDHLAPGFRPKYAIHELMCNYCLVLEEIDGSSSQLSLVEMFDGSLDCLRQTYAAEWNNHVDVMFQYARLNLNATALMRIMVENAGDCSHYLTDIQTLIIRGTEASSHLINDAKTIISETLAREGQSGCMPMPTCYPRAYFEQIFFAAVFIFRTSFIMRPSTMTTNRDAALRGLIETHSIYQLFPRHPDMAVGMEIIQHILRYVGSEDFSYETVPLGGLVRTNRLGASFVWDTLTGLIQLSGDEKFVDKRYHHERGYREDQESRMSQSTTDITASSSSSVVQGPVMQQPEQQQGLLDTTTTTTGGLPLPINLDWGDIDLALPTFDVFGLDAGEHIAW